MTRIDNARVIRAAHGTELSAKSWLTEAPLRMLMNNLDPDVAEKPGELVVYGGIGRAARDWDSFDRIVAALKNLNDDETLLVQSGKPVGVFRTHPDAPRVLIANSNLVPHWATWDKFHELDRKGLMMYGQMTAGSWIYIGTQGIVQGTYETFVEVGRQHYNGDLSGRWILTGGLGGMGGRHHQPALERAAEVLARRLREGLVRALQDPLRADVDPGPGRHLAVHHQALAIELVEVVPGGPVGDEHRVRDEDARCVGVRAEHPDRLARLYEQRLVVPQPAQRGHDGVEALPVTCGTANATVDHQLFRVLGDFRVEVVHQHAQRCFSQPAFGGQRVAAGCADFDVTEFFEVVVSHGNGS